MIEEIKGAKQMSKLSPEAMASIVALIAEDSFIEKVIESAKEAKESLERFLSVLEKKKQKHPTPLAIIGQGEHRTEIFD